MPATDPTLAPDPRGPQAVHLRPVEPGDYLPLRRYELDLTLGPRWRHRGSTPSPEAFAQSLWSGVLAQYLVHLDGTPEPLGLVTAYGVDLQSGTAWLAMARFPSSAHPAAFLVGARRFVDHLFATWPLRKLCAEVLAPNRAPFGTLLDRWFVDEGCHRGQAFLDGRYVDQHLVALWREQWAQATRGWSVVAQDGPEATHPSFEVFAAAVTEALGRHADDLDLDLPLVDQELDSLDWLVLADHLEQFGATEEAVLAALSRHLTLRSLHRWAVVEAAGAEGDRWGSGTVVLGG